MKEIAYLILSLTLFSCSNDSATKKSLPYDLSHQTYNNVLSAINKQLISEAVIEPDTDGAIGRNQAGYFHVRFQLDMNTVSDFAITHQRMDALEAAAKMIQYALDHQTTEGDFELVIPEDLQDIGEPLASDKASGVAFFGSSLGMTLYSLSKDSWYQNDAETQAIRQTIGNYDPWLEAMLDYLIRSKDMLFTVDQEAPNRLFFNAVAFHSLGQYLENEEAQSLGLEFAEQALKLQDDSSGFYIEGGGWDSSYNGVALKLALELYMILPASSFREKLEASIEKSAMATIPNPSFRRNKS